MREYPKGGLIGKAVHGFRAVRGLQVQLYAANACYFIVLAVFPALLLLLGILRYTPLQVEQLAELFYGFLPEPLAIGAEELILLTFDNTSGTVVGVSAIAALWSASRGIYGILTGLNAVYGASESRGYFYTRLISMIYMFAFLLMLIVTLWLHVVSAAWIFLPILQTAFFAVMFAVLPGEKNGVWESLPGALLAAFGWQIFSDAYSVYVEHFAHLSNVYGSVYAVALSMLWLYFCVSIVFYGGALNAAIKKRKNVSET